MISINGIKASGKTLLATALQTLGYGQLVSFFSGRWRFERDFLPSAYNLEKGDVRKTGTIPMFAVEWHKNFKHLDAPLIFDHFYPDHWVFDLEGFAWHDLERLAKVYRLPWLDEGKHFYLESDYETYKERKELRNLPNEGLFNEQDFCEWSARYDFLVDEGFLIKVDATQDPLSVFQEVVSHL